MELRQYWRIIVQRLWIIILLPLLVVAASFLVRPAAPTGAVANLRLAVGVAPEDGGGRYYTYDRYYTWLTAEYLADDLSEVLKSRGFADEVSRRLGGSVPAGSIQAATSPQKLHRIITVSVSAASSEQALAIAGAIAGAVRESSSQFLAELSAGNAVISVIDPPLLVPTSVGLRQRLDLPLRIVLALAAAVAIAFLLDYLDDSVRDSDDVAGLGLSVLGEIPK